MGELFCQCVLKKNRYLPVCLKLILKNFLAVTFLFWAGKVSCVAQDFHELKKVVGTGTATQRLDSSWQLFKYYRVSNPDTALVFAKINNEIAREIRDTTYLIRSYNAMGYLYKENADYDNAVENYKSGLVLAKEVHASDQIKYLLNNLAVVYTFYGKYDKSLEYHFESLKIREEEGDLVGMNVAYNNIGLVYYQLEDYDQALFYFQKSRSLTSEENINYDSERTLANIGLAYIGLEDFMNALKSFEELEKLCSEGNCETDIMLEIYGGLGLAYYEINEYSDAKIAYEQVLELARQVNNDIYLISANYYLALIYNTEGKQDLALRYLSTAEEIASHTDAQEWKGRIFNLYAEVYARQAEYELAYAFKEKAVNIRDSLLNNEVIKNIANVQLEYQDRLAQQQISKRDLEIERRTQFNLLMGGIIILVTVLLFILYKNIQLKKKANDSLAEAKAIIEQQNEELTNINLVLEERVRERTKELKEANVALKKSNEELDNFIYKTSHDIRGPLATLMGVCNIAQIDVEDKQALDYFDKLSLTAHKLNEILSKLLIINHINNTPINNENIPINMFIEQLINDNKELFSGHEITVEYQIEGDDVVFADPELLKIIYGNLLNNAFRFYNPTRRVDSFIHLNINNNNKDLAFTIVDNGIGINENMQERIFEIFGKATETRDSSGLGLYLAKLALEKLHGGIAYYKTSDAHTAFKVTIPKS